MQTRTHTIGIRLPLKDYKLLRQIAKARGIDVSDFVRQALRSEFAELSYLDDADKKALGVKVA